MPRLSSLVLQNSAKSLGFLLLAWGATSITGAEEPNQTAGGQPAVIHEAAPKKEIAMLAWNVESGGSDPAIISKQLTALAGYHIYALSEVEPSAFETFRAACGKNFKSVNSASGDKDRLQIIYNDEKWELIRKAEMDRYRDHTFNKGNLRSPLMAHFRSRTDKTEFMVVVNHLARGNEKSRNEQAIGLREWARDQSLPCVTIGDFNFDFDFATKRGNQGFIEILRDNIWSWVQPKELIDTNWYDPDKDGVDNFPDSMLDFAFIAGPAKTWKPTCQVIVREGDFPDDDKTSDHRPIELRLAP